LFVHHQAQLSRLHIFVQECLQVIPVHLLDDLLELRVIFELLELVDVCVTCAQVFEALGFVLDVGFVVALLDVGFDQSLDRLLVFVDVVHAQEHFAVRSCANHLHHFEVLDVECFHVTGQLFLGIFLYVLGFFSADDQYVCFAN